MEDLAAVASWAAYLAEQHQARVRTDLCVRDFPANTCVARLGKPADVWVGVVDGLVKLSTMSPDGKAVTLEGVASGGWFGEGSVLKRELRKYDIVTLRPSRVALLPASTFFYLLENSIPFNQFLLHQVNERLGHFIGALEHERMLGPDARVARTLAQLLNPRLCPGAGRHLRISQEELSHLAGISRQRVNRALRALDRAGLVQVYHGAITILDVDGLWSFGGG
ncbi:Crp/Fnr family transcriptional regulator [Ectothiorhodospiraceae bacterium WFHF3C12]|nr:Crp/Fnr family transcriptional regulator [Ectothiorhodospiraceae bacterium WFHF3C12]